MEHLIEGKSDSFVAERLTQLIGDTKIKITGLQKAVKSHILEGNESDVIYLEGLIAGYCSLIWELEAL